MTEPRLEMRGEQPYVAIRRHVTRQQLGPELGPHIGEVISWLAERHLSPSGAPFFRYLVVDTDQHLEVEAAVPVATAVSGAGRVSAGVLPAGQYLVSVHTGPFDGLQAATARLKAWATEHGIGLAVSDDGTAWKARLETYFTGPAEEPDPQRWVAEIAFLTAKGTASKHVST